MPKGLIHTTITVIGHVQRLLSAPNDGLAPRLVKVVNIITRTSHSESFTMSSTGFILNPAATAGRRDDPHGHDAGDRLHHARHPARGGLGASVRADEVRKTPSWPRSWANFSLL
jgi:hypothetical protein